MTMPLKRRTTLIWLGLLAGAAPWQRWAAAQGAVGTKPEIFLLLPEPKALATERSIVPEGAERTVFTAARETVDVPHVATYSKEEFLKLGLSLETFAERAARAADRRLAQLKPALIKDDAGKVRYAVYRGEKPWFASLLVAPSLPGVFAPLFGPEIWVALPDRHSLFVFPANPEALEEFVADLADRYRSDAHAASPEIFALKQGSPPRVVGSFAR